MSESNELTGKVHHIGEVQTFASGFTKRVLVIETDEKYPQTVPVEFAKDKTAKLDGLNIGQQVTVSYNLRGNEYNGKYYVNLGGWKISHVGEPVRTEAAVQAESVQSDAGEERTPF